MAQESKIKKEVSKENEMYSHFIQILQETLWIEEKLVDTLPKMEKAASTENLQEAFEDHYLQTKKHVSRLKKILQSMDEKISPKECKAFDEIIKDGEAWIKNTKDRSMLRDAMLIFSAQKVEHYEIATYGTLVAMAYTLNLEKQASRLNQTLEEEEETDQKLTDIAENDINFKAADEEEREASKQEE